MTLITHCQLTYEDPFLVHSGTNFEFHHRLLVEVNRRSLYSGIPTNVSIFVNMLYCVLFLLIRLTRNSAKLAVPINAKLQLKINLNE